MLRFSESMNWDFDVIKKKIYEKFYKQSEIRRVRKKTIKCKILHRELAKSAKMRPIINAITSL